ncbi:uncharacterized protein AKAME5_002417400, partial [Lates japonicus]
MMETCRGMSSSLCTSRYISWCVDSVTELPTPVITAPTATGEFSHPNHQSPGSGSVPLLLLSPPESSRGETTLSHQPPQPASTTRTHHKTSVHSHPYRSSPHSSSALYNIDKATNSHSDVSEDDDSEEGRKGNSRLPEAESRSEEDRSLLHPEAERFLLPRSSPVISRRHRPISWHGGETDATNLPSLDSPSPAAGSLSLHQHGRPTGGSMEDLGSKPSSGHHSSPRQEEKKQRCVSVSSNLNNFLISLFHLPFSGQQGSADEHRGQQRTSCDGPRTSGLSTSAKHSKQRSCSGIPESSADIFKTSCELEKENAHFIVVDMVLEVLEGVKWTLSCDRRTSTQHTDYNIGFEDCGVDTTLTPKDSLRNAEWLAQQLVLEFRRSWLPSREPRCGRQSLRSSLQELPGTGRVAVSGNSLTEEIRLRTRMRGSLNWAPPRFQIIFTVQPTLRRSEVVGLQHFLCAGCGTEVEPRYIKKLRYCEYLGRYFCDCCHSGSEAVIPGRVLSCWDFGRYPVSDFSKQLLDSVWHQPLFDLTCVGKTLCSRVKELDKFR